MFQRLSARHVGYSIAMAVACSISYLLMTSVLGSVVARDNDVLGGMWAAVAAAFVFRESNFDSVAAGASRLAATCVSFALCFAYLCFFRAAPAGIAMVLAVGTLVMFILNRSGEIITTAITTIVVMAVSVLSPADAWIQPLLRLADTIVGIGVGVLCNWAVSFAFRTVVDNSPRPDG
jgi:uncharacterized membrane protein YgaE (UPF0421/DUF939 family)